MPLSTKSVIISFNLDQIDKVLIVEAWYLIVCNCYWLLIYPLFQYTWFTDQLMLAHGNVMRQISVSAEFWSTRSFVFSLVVGGGPLVGGGWGWSTILSEDPTILLKLTTHTNSFEWVKIINKSLKSTFNAITSRVLIVSKQPVLCW